MDIKIKKIINDYNKKNLNFISIEFKKINYYNKNNQYLSKKKNKIYPQTISKNKLKINEMCYK